MVTVHLDTTDMLKVDKSEEGKNIKEWQKDGVTIAFDYDNVDLHAYTLTGHNGNDD